MADLALTCTSWNIHRAKGQDKRRDPQRTVDVLLAEVLAQGTAILALQEADEQDDPQRGFLDIPRIERETNLRYVQAARRHRWGVHSHGFFGVVLFFGADVQIEDMVLLDLPGLCHRGAIVADASFAGVRFRVVATHLSLGQPARIAQMRVIGQHLHRRSPRQTLLIGDLNEWRPWGGLALSSGVVGLRLRGPARRSFPVGLPLLPLDRIMTSAPGDVRNMRVLDGPGIRIASDHRPVTAQVRLGPARA